MFTHFRAAARLILLVCALFAGSTATTTTQSDAATTTNHTSYTGEQPLAGRNSEVRLRKLHLVRPDLIPYPMAYDVYC